MLIVTGTLNGQSYEEKAIDAAQLIAAVEQSNKAKGFQFPALETGKAYTFQVVPGTQIAARDRMNPGRLKVTPKWRMYPEYTVNAPGGTLTIRYAESRSPSRDGFKYTPKKIPLVSGSTFFSITGEKVDLLVWAYLHPDCASSPFARRPKYKYYDPAAEAQVGLAQLQAITEMQTVVLTMDEQSLRMRAASLQYSAGKSQVHFRAAAKVDIFQLRNALVRMLIRDKNLFIDAWDKAQHSHKGLIAMAESTGIIALKRTASGGHVWSYLPEYGGATIISVSKGQDPVQGLITEFASNPGLHLANIKNLISIVNTPTQPSAAKAPQAAAVIDESPLEDALTDMGDANDGIDGLISDCITHNVMSMDAPTGKVYLMKADGTKWRPVLAPKNPANWAYELAEYLAGEGSDKIDLITKRLKAQQEQ